MSTSEKMTPEEAEQAYGLALRILANLRPKPARAPLPTKVVALIGNAGNRGLMFGELAGKLSQADRAFLTSCLLGLTKDGVINRRGRFYRLETFPSPPPPTNRRSS